jgi:TetR/AcrR family transcriptional regulator
MWGAFVGEGAEDADPTRRTSRQITVSQERYSRDPDMTTMRHPDPEGIRQRARAAAVRMFARYGFEGTSVQAIADEVGVSKQALLYHFQSKEGLRQAALEDLGQRWETLLPQLLGALTRPEVPFDEALGEVVSQFRAEPSYARFLMQELLQSPEKNPVLTNVEPWLGAAAERIREAQRAGTVDPSVDPRAWLLLVSSLLVTAFSLQESLEGNLGAADAPQRLSAELARIIGSSLRR